MKKINNYIVYDTSVGSLNVGDQIINRSFNNEMNEILSNGFIVRYPTHTPVSHSYQNNKFNRFYRYVKSCKNKFIVGTNLLANNMLQPWPNWNVNIFNFKPYKDSILVGCGSASDEMKMNIYTQTLYKKILSKNYVHSVRDEKTKKTLEMLGVKAVNTGCVTMWSLTQQHCKKIKKEKSENVIFTLTDYKKDLNKDQALIDILVKNYEKVYYWVQGSNDLEYLNTFNNIENIKIVAPNLDSFEKVLVEKNIDYVGTRLHAGIFAMQHFVRSIILIVDNRARDIKENYNIVSIERDDIEENLEKMLNSEFETNISIDEDKINKWKEQFKSN